MPSTLENKIAIVLDRISVEAMDDKSSLYLNYAFTNNTDLWYFSEGKTEEWLEAKKILEQLGFTVEFISKHSSYANQPSAKIWNRGTLISWSKK